MSSTVPSLAALVGAALAVSSLPALAGGECRNCYREVVEPPVYQTSVEPVLVRGPRTGAYVIPARYATVREQVEIEPARQVWQVSVDQWGRRVGCWVTLPARTEWRNRRVVSHPAEIVPVAMPTVYGVRQTRVMVAPSRPGWEPVQDISDFRVESVVSRY